MKLDDHEYLPHWEGNLASLSETPEWAIPRLRSLGLWAQGSTVRFHSVRLRLVSGRTSLDAGVATLAPPQVAPAAVVSEKPSGPPKFALNQWVDVLRFVDTTKNSVKGKWSRSESEISCNARNVAEIQIPVVVDGSYELEVEFTRDRRCGCQHDFSVGPRQCMLHLCSGGGKNAGLDWVDGQSCQVRKPDGNRAGCARQRPSLPAFGQSAVRANRASVDVALDGNRYLPHWEGGAESLDLSQGWFTLPNPRQLGLAIYKNHVTFHSVRLKMTSGRASVDASAVDTASPRGVPPMNASGDPAGTTKFPLGQSVEVLQLVDPAKHAVAGRWSRMENKIKVEPDNQSRIVIPVAVAGSYDLEVELNRHDGTGDLHTTLPVGSHSCDISVGQDGHIGGLESIDNRRAFDKANPITAYAPVFENDHTYHLLAKVRVSSADHASVDVSLDGKPYLPHWEGDPAILSVSKDWAMPTVDHLGLGVWRSQVTYSSGEVADDFGPRDRRSGIRWFDGEFGIADDCEGPLGASKDVGRCDGGREGCRRQGRSCLRELRVPESRSDRGQEKTIADHVQTRRNGASHQHQRRWHVVEGGLCKLEALMWASHFPRLFRHPDRRSTATYPAAISAPFSAVERRNSSTNSPRSTEIGRWPLLESVQTANGRLVVNRQTQASTE